MRYSKFVPYVQNYKQTPHRCYVVVWWLPKFHGFKLSPLFHWIKGRGKFRYSSCSTKLQQVRLLVRLTLTIFLVPPPKNGFGSFSFKFLVPIRVGLSTRFSQSMEMSRPTRDGTAEPVSRYQILRRERGQGNIHFAVQLTTCKIGNLTRLIHTLATCVTIHRCMPPGELVTGSNIV